MGSLTVKSTGDDDEIVRTAVSNDGLQLLFLGMSVQERLHAEPTAKHEIPRWSLPERKISDTSTCFNAFVQEVKHGKISVHELPSCQESHAENDTVLSAVPACHDKGGEQSPGITDIAKTTWLFSSGCLQPCKKFSTLEILQQFRVEAS